MKKFNINHYLAIRLNKLMQERKWNQSNLCMYSDVPNQTISDILNEKNPSCDFVTVFKLASAFNMSLSQFFDDPIFDKLKSNSF